MRSTAKVGPVSRHGRRERRPHASSPGRPAKVTEHHDGERPDNVHDPQRGVLPLHVAEFPAIADPLRSMTKMFSVETIFRSRTVHRFGTTARRRSARAPPAPARRARSPVRRGSRRSRTDPAAIFLQGLQVTGIEPCDEDSEDHVPPTCRPCRSQRHQVHLAERHRRQSTATASASRFDGHRRKTMVVAIVPFGGADDPATPHNSLPSRFQPGCRASTSLMPAADIVPRASRRP